MERSTTPVPVARGGASAVAVGPPPTTDRATGRPGVRDGVLDTIGDTPLVRLTGYLDTPDVELLLKLEASNPGGSTKDRPATAMVEDALHRGVIGPGTVVVESSSGNTGIGLAQVCRYHRLRFVCVVDGRAQRHTLAVMRALGAEIDRIDAPLDGSVDLLTARLTRVAELLDTLPDAFWPNQYANPQNPLAHERGTMSEIDAALGERLDHLFVAVSSTGTLGGCLDHLAAAGRRARVTAVDAVGSVLFGGDAGRRIIPGLGAGCVPPLADGHHDVEVVRVTDRDCVVGCRRLALTDALLVGGSAGGVLEAVRARQLELRGRTVVVIAADSGHRYLDTVYDDAWVQAELGVDRADLDRLVGPVPDGPRRPAPPSAADALVGPR